VVRVSQSIFGLWEKQNLHRGHDLKASILPLQNPDKTQHNARSRRNEREIREAIA
jgi:hypothetical protein